MEDWERPVVAFEIRGRDSQRLREFYAALFNWKMSEGDRYRISPGSSPGSAARSRACAVCCSRRTSPP